MRAVIVRPHPIILEKMTSFLGESGFDVQVANDIASLNSITTFEPEIVIVSTAAHLSGAWPLKAALVAVRGHWRGVPLLLTTAVEGSKARASLQDIMNVVDSDVRVMLPEEISASGKVDKKGVAIVVNKLQLDALDFRRSLSGAIHALLGHGASEYAPLSATVLKAP